MPSDTAIIHATLLDELLRRREPTSVVDLSQACGLSTADVYRELDRLAAAGCELSNEPGRGVSLVQSGLPAWKDYLDDRFGVPLDGNPSPRRIEVYRSTTSTQDAVRRLIDAHGASADGAIVVAEEQTAGRGRLGRRWVNPSGPAAGLTFSRAFVRDDKTPATTDRIVFATAVAVARAIEKAADVVDPRVRIKWPNDLLVDGRKIAGILVESVVASKHAHIAAAVIGIGINVSMARDSVPDDLKPIADRVTSMAMCGWRVDRLRLLAETIEATDIALGADDPQPLLDEWRSRCHMLGQEIRVSNNGRQTQGMVVDLDPVRGLVLRTSSGEIVMLPGATTTILGP